MATEREELIRKAREFANERADKIAGTHKNKTRKKRKKTWLAEKLFDGDSLEYGFEESIEKDNYGPFPHEIENLAECVVFAARQYFLAEAMGLNPKIFWIYGVKNHKYDMNSEVFEVYDHAFIDTDVGRPKRLAIDVQMDMYGYVTYDQFKGEMRVTPNGLTKNTARKFTKLEEITFDEMVDRLIFMRSPEGTIRLLEQGQSMKKFQAMYQFDSEAMTLETRTHITNELIVNNLLRQRFHFDEEGNEDGSEIEFGSYTKVGWSTYENHMKIAQFDERALTPFFASLEALMATRYASPWKRRKYSSEIAAEIASMGLKDFEVDASKVPEGIDSAELAEETGRMEALVRQEYAKLPGNEGAEIFENALLVRELYRIELEKRKAAGEDHDGFIYPEDERDEILVDKIEGYYQGMIDFFEFERGNVIRQMKKSHWTHTIPKEHQMFDKAIYARGRSVNLLTSKVRNPDWYNDTTDIVRYKRQELEGMTAEQMKERIAAEGGDPYNAYKTIVFRRTVNACKNKTILRNQRVLPKLAKKVKEYVMFMAVKEAVEAGETDIKPEDLYTDALRSVLPQMYKKLRREAAAD